jgi:flagellar P-ring protein precursor FlgI
MGSKLYLPAGLMIAIQILLLLVTPAHANKVRIKDICSFQNKQDADLLGYGLVIGLDGTGDGNGTQFTTQSLVNMMQRMGLTVDPGKVKVKNVAAVIVTGRISSQQGAGSYFDVTVSSVGDAKSLQGGTLLMTPLSGPDGMVHATAQGQVSIGGFNVQVDEGNKIVNNYTLVGRIPNGAKVTSAIEATPGADREIVLALTDPDITTSQRIAQRINIEYGTTAYAMDGGSVKIAVPDSLSDPNSRMRFLSDVSLLQVEPDGQARVIINERTGTIVAGQDVTIEPVAIAHGTITVNIQSRPSVSQPEPFSQGQTTTTQEPQIAVTQEKARVVELPAAVKLSDITSALNKIGVTPRDIVAIFQALKQAGALRSELVIM